MTIYCGVDFHARQQTVRFRDTSDGEARLEELHDGRDDIRAFYSQFAGEVVVGLEASGYSTWFVELLEGLGHQVLIGDATEIRRLARRRQKNDRRDAALILDLLRKGEVLTETQEALGHKNLATTRAYVQRIAVRRDKHSRRIVERFGRSG